MILTYNGGWNDLRCNAQLPFWCEAATVPGCMGAPTNAPVAAPTRWPTLTPTLAPTQLPTQPPSKAPIANPTLLPSLTPTLQPSNKSAGPAAVLAPTQWPTLTPTLTPSQPPSQPPTNAPVASPTLQPSRTPTSQPSTLTPTPLPTLSPTTARPSPLRYAPPVTPPPTNSPLRGSFNDIPSASPVKLPTPAPFAQVSTFDVNKWHVGGTGQSCESLCSSLSLVPDAAQEVTLTTPAVMDAVAAKHGYACSVYLPSSQPFIDKEGRGCQFLLAGAALDAAWSSSLPPLASMCLLGEFRGGRPSTCPCAARGPGHSNGRHRRRSGVSRHRDRSHGVLRGGAEKRQQWKR